MTVKELVNTCIKCGKELYCIDGFFNGVYSENQQAFCFDCIADEKSAE